MAITTALRAASASATALICCPRHWRCCPAASVPGAYVVSVKPIDALLTAITEFESVRSGALMQWVVGGGAAAVEVALALAWRWRESTRWRAPSLLRPRCWMAFRRGHAARALQACKRLGVSVLENPVCQIDPTRLRLEKRQRLRKRSSPCWRDWLRAGLCSISVALNRQWQ